ncbi:MAG: hypothetical protein WA739_25120, partial [Candidatus Acidiferrales bacterium]
MKFTRPNVIAAVRWLLVLTLFMVPNVAWGQKHGSSGGSAPKAASAPHSSAPSGGGSHPSGASTASHGGGATTANHGSSGATTAN